MCGIAGFTGHGDSSVIKKMTDSLIHRGPDDDAYFQDAFCSLGMRRLAIIDLTPAIYPLLNEDKTLICVFNGEIYNFKDVKKVLLRKKHRFKTQCDAEVLVHGYEEWGSRLPEHLNGMFAFCIYDTKKKELFLARDRMGKKPLYWSLVAGKLIFGSELKAILQNSTVKKELNIDALYKYLSYEYVPSPNTIFQKIHQLEAGHSLTYSNGKVKISQYWDEKFPDTVEQTNESELINELDRTMEQAVERRLMADVPLGVFLSGGIDSSTIAYYMTRLMSKKVQSFSIGFDDPSFDESFYARSVATFLKTDHHEEHLDVRKTLQLIPDIYAKMDEPFADPSLIPTYLLTKFTRTAVTVALGGDGADELFMGYPTYQAHKAAQVYLKIPALIRSTMIEPLIRSLPTSFKNISLDFQLKRFIEGMPYPEFIRNQIWLGESSDAFGNQVLQPEVKRKITGSAFEDSERYWRQYLFHSSINDQVLSREQFWQAMIYLYLKTYLQNDILTKVDRASMMNSLEVRAPFLDYQVVNFVNRLPVRLKLHGWSTKYLLKKLMKNRLPDSILQRKKKGFGIPVSKWLLSDLRPLMHDLLSKKNLSKDGIFNYQSVQALISAHEHRKQDNRKKIWMLMVFQLWKNQWLPS